MAFTSEKWLISRKGTVLIPDAARKSDVLIARVETIATRKPLALSYLRVPPQSIFGYMTCRDLQGFVVKEIPIRFSRQRETLFSLDQIQIGINLCEGLNSVWQSLFEELAKKPNLPGIPPSVPPTIDLLAAVPRQIIHGIDSVTVAMLEYQCDFTLELLWLERQSSGCAPEPTPEEPTSTPLSGGLPAPGPGRNAPPGGTTPPVTGGVFPPPLTANVPAGFDPNDQYLPPTAAGFQYNLPANYISFLDTSVSPARCTTQPLYAVAFAQSDLTYSDPVLVSQGGQTLCDPNYFVTLGGVGLRFAGLPQPFTVTPLTQVPSAGFGVAYPR